MFFELLSELFWDDRFKGGGDVHARSSLKLFFNTQHFPFGYRNAWIQGMVYIVRLKDPTGELDPTSFTSVDQLVFMNADIVCLDETLYEKIIFVDMGHINGLRLVFEGVRRNGGNLAFGQLDVFFKVLNRKQPDDACGTSVPSGLDDKRLRGELLLDSLP